MKYLMMTALASMSLMACDPAADFTGSEDVYAEDAAKFPMGARKEYVDAQLGEPRYYEAEPDGRAACGIYGDTAMNGNKIVREMRYQSNVLVGQVIGEDYGLAACDPSAPAE